MVRLSPAKCAVLGHEATVYEELRSWAVGWRKAPCDIPLLSNRRLRFHGAILESEFIICYYSSACYCFKLVVL